MPNLYAASVPRQACLVFGCVLVWKVFEATTKPDEGHIVPSLNDLGERNHLPSGTNHIERANLDVAGLDANLHVLKCWAAMA